MNKIEEFALEIFSLDKGIQCKDIPEHHVCLFCNKCREHLDDSIVYDFSRLNNYIDHTLLKADARSGDINRMCEDWEMYKFKNICINPVFISLALNHTFSIPICTVVGFPLGANTTEIKLIEAKNAIGLGANEIDMVINISALKDKNYQYILNEISQIAYLCTTNNVLLKVIIETCLLTEDEIIMACLISKKAGADFIKTSTGFSVKGAEIESVRLIRRIVGNRIGVKASGGIKSRADALAMIEAGASRIGTSSSVSIMNESL